MKQKVLFILLNDYADWEGAYLASCLQNGIMEDSPTPYEVKTVAPTLDFVTSLGGFRTVPDYSFDTMPSDYAALVLIGGLRWHSREAQRVAPILRRAIAQHKIIGAICNGASFMARKGFLNNVRHTGNGLEHLRSWGGKAYTNAGAFVRHQAVTDQHIVTANGTGALEFARELLLLLQADAQNRIYLYYNFNKNGFFEE